MDNGRMLDLMIQTREDVADIKRCMESLDERLSRVEKDVNDLKKVPASRWNAVVSTLIASGVGGVVGFLISILTRGGE